MDTTRPKVVSASETPGAMRDTALYMLRVRKAAQSYLGPVGQSEPAWKLMLALYGAGGAPDGWRMVLAARRANLPLTTALRWLSRLQRHGFVSLHPDPADKRATRVQLTASGLETVQRSFVAARFTPT